MLGYVKTFLPWITFAVVGTNGFPAAGAVAGLVLAAVLIALDKRRGRGWDELVIETSSALFFAVLCVSALFGQPKPFGAYGTAVSIAWLAVTAWGSMLVRRPFTLGIAKKMAPAELHANPHFLRAMYLITGVWAVGFTVEAGAIALLNAYAPNATAALIAVKLAGFAGPAVFTVRYRAAMDKRRAAAAAEEARGGAGARALA